MQRTVKLILIKVISTIMTSIKRSKNLGKLKNKEINPIIIVRLGTKIAIRIIMKTTTN